MFRKDRDLESRSKSLLKNKEIRSLKTAIAQQYPIILASESSQTTTDENSSFLNELIPNKSDVTATKLANRTILYSINDIVLFFDLQGRNQLYPTLHALWRCVDAKVPLFVRPIITHGPVSRYVLKGADFMIPGIATKVAELEGIRVGERVCIMIKGNPLPIAVGDSCVDFKMIMGRDRGESIKGKAVTVIHSFGDLLTQKVTPNGGFTAEEVFPIDEQCDSEDSDEDASLKDTDLPQEKGKEIDVSDGAVDDSLLVNKVVSLKIAEDPEENFDREGSSDDGDGEDDNCEREEERTKEEGEEALEEGIANASIAQVQQQQQEEDIFNLSLIKALVLTFKYIVKDKQLPMLVSTLWTILQKCHSLVSGPLDLKRTSFRKPLHFLSYCQQIEFLQFKEENGIITITQVKRLHELFRAHKVEDPELFREEVTGVPSIEELKKLEATGKIHVHDLFKLPKKLRDVFGSIRGEFGEHLKAKEVKDLLTMYLKTHELEVPDCKNILRIPPSDLLFSIIYADLEKKRKPQVTTNPEKVGSDASGKFPAAVTEDSESLDQTDFGQGSSSVFDTSAWTAAKGPAIGLKVHKDGLKMIDENGGVAVDPSASSAASSWNTKTVGTTSSGTRFLKPVSLPSQKAPTTASALGSSTAAAAGASFSSSLSKSQAKQKSSYSSSNAAAELSNEPVELTKEEFIKLISSKMTPYHAIVQGDGTARIHSGGISKVQILVETRMGRKSVTLLRGLDQYDIDLSQLAKDCQKNVSVSSVPGIAQSKEIVLQGNYPFELETYLADIYGIPKHVIEISVGKGVKAKKRVA